MTVIKHVVLLALACSCLPGVAADAETVNYRDRLAANDDKLDTGEFADPYPLELIEGQAVELTMTSDDFDTYLMVQPPEGDSIENDDVSPSDFNSRLVFVAPKTGTYTVVATSSMADEAGTYHVRARIESTALIDREAGKLSPDDRLLLKGGEFADTTTITLAKGEGRVISVLDAGFDAYLVVHTPDGEVIVADDPPALLIQAPDNKGGDYRVVITSYEAGEVGAYTLETRRVMGRAPGIGRLGDDDAHRARAHADRRRGAARGVAVGLERDGLAPGLKADPFGSAVDDVATPEVATQQGRQAVAR